MIKRFLGARLSVLYLANLNELVTWIPGDADIADHTLRSKNAGFHGEKCRVHPCDQSTVNTGVL